MAVVSQADPNRTIEEVAVKIEHLTRRAARGLLSNHQNTAVKILEAWDRFKKISTDNQNVIRTTVEEARFLEQKAEVLLDVLDRLDEACPAGKADSLRSKIAKVISQAKLMAKSGSSSGGTFEWVDSLLVKALQEGRWLLMDNVNLCSASVLDRLNGLLEPNGTLTLSERGVIDGQIPEVRPHARFRLFLALDPRYGEISRAMRNRGVELFVHGADEVQYPESDLVSVVQSSGLFRSSLQRALLDFHQWLSADPVPVPERPTLNELVQAARLTAQRLAMLPSSNPLTCLEEVCREIYVRNLRSPVVQEQALEKLTEIVQSGEMPESTALVGPAMSGKDVEQNAVLARVQQACLLVDKVDGEGARDAVLLLVLTASREDLDWRLQKLNSAMSDADGVFLAQLRESLVKFIEPSDLPWDARWFNNVLRHHSRSDVNNEDESTGTNNRISLLLFWTAWNRSLSVPDRNSRNFYNLVLALNSGALAEEAVPDRLLVVLPRFLNQLDSRIQLLLTSPHVRLTNSDWSEMMIALIMRIHMTELDGLSVENDQLESTLSRIGQYWEWLCKWTLPVATRLLRQFDLHPLEVPDVSSSSRRASAIVSRRLRRQLEASEPFQDERQAKCSRLMSVILSLTTQPALVSFQRGIELVQSLPELFASGDVDKLTDVEREMRKLATESSSLDSNRLLMFALLDHLIALHLYTGNQPTAVPTGSGALLKAGQLPAVDSYLSHWETVTRLSWTRYHSPSWQVVSPVLSLVAVNYRESNAEITIGQSREQFAQFGFVKEILWNSTRWMQSNEFDPLTNDRRLAAESLDRLILGVNQALRLNESDFDASTNFGIQPDAINALQTALKLREDVQHLGSLWLLQGLARCLLLVPHEPVDPVEKRILKKQIRSHDKDRVERFVNILRIHHELLVGGELFIESAHPHARFFVELIERLIRKSSEDAQLRPAWRPETSLFLQYVKDVRHYVNSVGSASSIFTLHDKLTSSEMTSTVSEAELWLTAQQKFYETLKEKYADYPDLIVPFMAGMAQMAHGVRLLVRKLRANVEERRLSVADLSESIANLFDRPSTLAAEQPAGLVKLAELSTSAGVVHLIRSVVDDPVERGVSVKNLLLSALKDVERYCHHARTVDAHAWNTSQYVLDTLVSAWIANGEKIKQRQLESESMYKTRTVHHEGELSDAEKEARAIREYFPSYEADFNDEEQTSASPAEDEADEFDIPLSSADEDFICKFHTNLLLSWAKSMRLTNKKRGSSQSVDGGFFLRYPMLRHVLNRLEPTLSTEFDRRLIGKLQLCFT